MASDMPHRYTVQYDHNNYETTTNISRLIQLSRLECAAEICGNMVQNCMKPTTPSHPTGVRTHGWCHSVSNQMVEVTKPNREIGNTNNIKTAIENANLCGKKICDMCILLEICEKQDNMRNMRQSHSVKLTCLTELHDWAQVDPVNRAFIGQV